MPDDLAADVVFRAVGVERHRRTIEGDQQLGLVGMQPGQQAVQGYKAGRGGENPLEARLQLPLAVIRRVATVGFEVGVEPP